MLPLWKERGAQQRFASMELPGIEPAPKMTLTCGMLKSTTRTDAKVREMTCGYAKGVDGINTMLAFACVATASTDNRS